MGQSTWRRGWYIHRSDEGHVKPERQAMDEAWLCHLKHKGDFYSARKQKRKKEDFLVDTHPRYTCEMSGNIHGIFSFPLKCFCFGSKILSVWLMLGCCCTFEIVVPWQNSASNTSLCCNDPEHHWPSGASGAGPDYWRGGQPRAQVTTILQEAKTWAVAAPLHSSSNGKAVQFSGKWSGSQGGNIQLRRSLPSFIYFFREAI